MKIEMNKDLLNIIIREIDGYYGYVKEDNFKIRNTITDVTGKIIASNAVDGKPIELEVTITTKRPGIIIGSAGKEIDALKDYLTKELGLQVTVLIIENRLEWYAGRTEDYFDALDFNDYDF